MSLTETIRVSVDTSDFDAFVRTMSDAVTRFEAAAAAQAPEVESDAVAVGPIATALVAGAVMAGSSTKRVSRRALLGLGFLQRERGAR